MSKVQASVTPRTEALLSINRAEGALRFPHVGSDKTAAGPHWAGSARRLTWVIAGSLSPVYFLIITARSVASICDENVSSAPARRKTGERAMVRHRRRFKQSIAFKDRLATFAKDMRDKASQLKPGIERDDCLRKARQADTASHLDEWANSPGLQPPTRSDQ